MSPPVCRRVWDCRADIAVDITSWLHGMQDACKVRRELVAHPQDALPAEDAAVTCGECCLQYNCCRGVWSSDGGEPRRTRLWRPDAEHEPDLTEPLILPDKRGSGAAPRRRRCHRNRQPRSCRDSPAWRILVVKAEKVIRFNVLPLRRVQHVQTRLTM